MYQQLFRHSGTALAQCNAKLVVLTVCSFLAVLADVFFVFPGLWSMQPAGRGHYHLLTKHSVGCHSEMRIHRHSNHLVILTIPFSFLRKSKLMQFAAGIRHLMCLITLQLQCCRGWSMIAFVTDLLWPSCYFLLHDEHEPYFTVHGDAVGLFASLLWNWKGVRSCMSCVRFLL